MSNIVFINIRFRRIITLCVLHFFILISSIFQNVLFAQSKQTWKFIENKDSIVYTITHDTGNLLIIRIEANNRAYRYMQSAFYEDTFVIYNNPLSQNVGLKELNGNDSTYSFQCRPGLFKNLYGEPIKIIQNADSSSYQVTIIGGIMDHPKNSISLISNVYLYFTEEHIPVGFELNFHTQEGNMIKLNKQQTEVIRSMLKLQK